MHKYIPVYFFKCYSGLACVPFFGDHRTTTKIRLPGRDMRASPYRCSRSLVHSWVHTWCCSVSERFSPLRTPGCSAVRSLCMLAVFFTWLTPVNTWGFCLKYDHLLETFLDCPSSLIFHWTHNTWSIFLSHHKRTILEFFCCFHFPQETMSS